MKSGNDSWRRWILLILFWGYALSLAADFRGAGGLTAAHALMMAMAFGCGGGILLLGFRFLFVLPFGYVAIGIMGYIGMSLISAHLGGVELVMHLKAASALYMILLGLFVIQVMAAFGFTIKEILQPVVLSGFLAIFFRFSHSLSFDGKSLDEIRTLVLSRSLPYVLPYAIAVLMLRKRLRIHALVVLGAAAAVIAASVTRTYLLTIALSVFVCMIGWGIAVYYRFWSMEELFEKWVQLGKVVIFVALPALVLLLSLPGVGERWIERVGRLGKGPVTADITALTRQAETKSIIEIVEKDPWRRLYGCGYGQAYGWHSDFFPQLAVSYGSVPEIYRVGHADLYTYPGHSTWTYAYFSGGWIGVFFHILLFVVPPILAFRAIQLGAFSGIPFVHLFIPIVCIVGAFSQSLTDNPIRERSGGLYFGLTVFLSQVHFVRLFRNNRYTIQTQTLSRTQ